MPFRLTYRPLSRAGWSLAALYPEDELLAEVAWLRTVQGLLALGGLALLALVVVLLSRRFTRPLAGPRRERRRRSPGATSTLRCRPSSRATRWGRWPAPSTTCATRSRSTSGTSRRRPRRRSGWRASSRSPAASRPTCCRGPWPGGPTRASSSGRPSCRPAPVGGDLFDHFRDGARVFFLVGDVSGKGIAAALFMARAKTVFETVASREADPAALLATVNRSLCRDNDAGMFVTAVVGVLDLASGDLAFAVAGHEPPVLVPADGPPELVSVGGRARARPHRGVRLPGEPAAPRTGRRGRPLHRRGLGGAGRRRAGSSAWSGWWRPPRA